MRFLFCPMRRVRDLFYDDPILRSINKVHLN